MAPWMRQRAAALDDAAAFPNEEISALTDAGVLALSLPNELDPSADTRAAADLLACVLACVGEGNLSVGRVVEAHFNARHLIARYGSVDQRARAAEDVAA